MAGGLLQLAAYGPQNLYLTGNPQITFFIAVYKRHTNFSIESIQQFFHGNIDFGSKVYCDIAPKGDLIHQIFLQVRLPSLNENPPINEEEDNEIDVYGINNGSNDSEEISGEVNNCFYKYCKPYENEYQVSYVNSIGHAIIKNVDIEIGGTLIDRHYGMWLEIWNQLTQTSEKKYAYDTMIGRHENFNLNTQPGPLNLYIPFQFWFNRYIGLSLPLISLQYSTVRIYVEFRKLEELYVSTDMIPPGLGPENNSSLMTSNKLGMTSLWVDYIFLETEERKKFANCNLEYLIDQLQVNTQGVNETNYVLPMTFNHPVKELIWVFQTGKLFRDMNIENNNYEFFDFSDGNVPPEDPFLSGKIRFEGSDRHKEREPEYFRIIQPYQYHTRVPKNYIYLYSFAVKPEEHQPTGTCNFSRIDNATIEMTLSNSITQKETQIIIYAVNYNILKIEAGIAGLIYAN